MLAVGKASLGPSHPVHGEGGDLPVGQRDVDPVPGVQVLEVVEHRDGGERIHVAEDDRRAALAGRRAVPVPAGQVVVVERRYLHRAVRVQADLHHRRVDVDARDADADRNRAGQRLSLRVVGQPRRDGRHRCRGVSRPGIGGRTEQPERDHAGTAPAQHSCGEGGTEGQPAQWLASVARLVQRCLGGRLAPAAEGEQTQTGRQQRDCGAARDQRTATPTDAAAAAGVGAARRGGRDR